MIGVTVVLLLSCLLRFAPLCSCLFREEAEFQLDLPSTHVVRLLNRRPDLKNLCLRQSCPYQNIVAKAGKRCWGFEPNCSISTGFSKPVCDGVSNWPTAKDKVEQLKIFYNQADFGYIRERIDTLQLICESTHEDHSSLICSDHLRYCHGRNIFFDFKSLYRSKNYNKYRDDVINEGEVGGNCDSKFDSTLLQSRADHKSFLQSWGHELIHFKSYANFKVNKKSCDIVYSKPTIIIKLDAGISMFHHFCDFVNLYASQHINGSFAKDVDIVIWETSTSPYSDYFADTWKVFSSNKLQYIHDFEGKKVCFKNAMMPLLARMQFGLYYNMPLVTGCHGSGLMKAFSQHVLHRLKILQLGPKENKIRVTLLTRSTKFRRILNEDELLNALSNDSQLEVTKVDYNHQLPFLKQLAMTHNSDIFIGIHGSGLTHLLFLPDWAVIFELYNCDDAGCYSDLARIRGVKYFTWERKDKVFPEDEGHHPQLGAHAKFTNYRFDVDEFVSIVRRAQRHVLSHPKFVGQRRQQQQQKVEL